MRPESGTSREDVHVVGSLVDYFTGGLSAADDVAVQAHLLSCDDCRAEFDELGSMALIISAGPAHVPQFDDVGAEAGVEVGGLATGTAHAPRPRRPAGAARVGRPPRARRASLRVLGYAAAVLLGVGLGTGGWLLMDRVAAPSLAPVDSTRATDNSRLTVTLVPLPDGRTEVRGAVVGLRAGRGYQLIVVDRDGRGSVVASGVAAGGVESITGTLTAPAAGVSFVVLAEDGRDGAVLAVRPS
jgi:anti-sigma factor RsiW